MKRLYLIIIMFTCFLLWKEVHSSPLFVNIERYFFNKTPIPEIPSTESDARFFNSNSTENTNDELTKMLKEVRDAYPYFDRPRNQSNEDFSEEMPSGKNDLFSDKQSKTIEPTESLKNEFDLMNLPIFGVVGTGKSAKILVEKSFVDLKTDPHSPTRKSGPIAVEIGGTVRGGWRFSKVEGFDIVFLKQGAVQKISLRKNVSPDSMTYSPVQYIPTSSDIIPSHILHPETGGL